MVNFYGNLNEGSLALLTIGVFVGMFVAAQWLFHRFFPQLRFGKDSSGDGQIYGGAIGTVFALIFAFVIVAVWQNFDRVSSAVEQEANVLNDLYGSMQGYPPELRDEVRAKLTAYVERVVQKEWKLVESNQQDPGADALITDITSRLTTYRPAELGLLPLHMQTLQLLFQNRNLRHDRIKAGLSYLDASMWISLALGGVILLLFSCMLNVGNRRTHFLMHASLGASIGLIFFLLFVYNFPFLGPGAVGPEALRVLPERYWVSK